MDKELFKSLPGTILDDQSFGLLMADLKEIKGKLLQVFQTPDFIPKPLFKSELETLDPIQLANKDPIEITKLMYLIILSCCFCAERDTFIEKLESLSENAIAAFYNVPKMYLVFDDNDRDSIRESIRNTIHKKATNKSLGGAVNDEYIDQYVNRIKYLEDELKKELDNKDKIFTLQKQLDEANNKMFQLQNQNKDYEYKIKHLTDEKNNAQNKLNSIGKDVSKIPAYKKTIEELTNKMKAKDDELDKLKKEFGFKEENYRDQIAMLNKQSDIYKDKAISVNEIQSKYQRLLNDFEIQKDKCNHYDVLLSEYNTLKKSIEIGGQLPMAQSTKVEIEKLKAKVNEQDRTIIEQKKKIEQYEAQIDLLRKEKDSNQNILEEKIESNLPEKKEEVDLSKENKEEEIQNDIVIQELNLRLKELTEELDKCKEVKDNIAKYYQKDTDEMQARYQKEFELISSAIYNLGFTFWSMKYEYEQKLIKNPNWLITERQKKFNGDY